MSESEVTMWDDVPTPKGEGDEVRPIIGPRLTVVQTVYHQRPDMPPTSRESRWDCLLVDDEQPYYREMTIASGSEKTLETGWIDVPGTVLIENLEGQFHSVNPTEAERAEVAGLVLMLCVDRDKGLPFKIPIRPGDCQRICLSSENPMIEALYVKNAGSRSIRYSLTVFAR